MTRHADVARSSALRKVLPVLCDLAGADRRRSGAQSRHDRRLDREQRSGRGLSGRGDRSRRDGAHEQARDRGGRLFQGPVRNGARTRRNHQAIEFPVPRRAAYCKFPNPASRYAVAGVLVADFGGKIRVGVTGAGPCAFRAVNLEASAEREARAASGRCGRNRLRPVQQRPACDGRISRKPRARDGAARGCRADRANGLSK